MSKKEILIIENLAAFEKLINKDEHPYDINLMCMPGTLEDKHKDVDPEKGIQPLRRRFNLIYLLLGGVHDIHLGADYKWLKPNDLVIVPENMVYASSNIRNCTGYCIHFKTEFIQPVLTSPFTAEFPFFNSEAEHIININDDESRLIQHSFKDIISEYERTSAEKNSLLKNYIYILLLRIRELYRPYAKKINENLSRTEILANKFKHLVEANFLRMREVQEYAEKINISPKYLTDVVKETFGKTPREIINDMLLLEAKVQLGSTDKTITEIAFDLNFTVQSHFTHFIKQHLNCSPLEYRQKWLSNTEEARKLSTPS